MNEYKYTQKWIETKCTVNRNMYERSQLNRFFWKLNNQCHSLISKNPLYYLWMPHIRARLFGDGKKELRIWENPNDERHHHQHQQQRQLIITIDDDKEWMSNEYKNCDDCETQSKILGPFSCLSICFLYNVLRAFLYGCLVGYKQRSSMVWRINTFTISRRHKANAEQS